MDPNLAMSEEDLFPYFKDALTFGRPGCGAPVRTRSGRLRTALIGNPEIRFQPNESVQKTIYNTIRYQADRDTKEQYHRALGKRFNFSSSIGIFQHKNVFSRGANTGAKRQGASIERLRQSILQ